MNSEYVQQIPLPKTNPVSAESIARLLDALKNGTIVNIQKPHSEKQGNASAQAPRKANPAPSPTCEGKQDALHPKEILDYKKGEDCLAPAMGA